MAKVGKVIGGAGKGAAIGSTVLPGVGTIIGGALGALGGLFGGGPSKEELAYQEALADLDQLEIPTEEKRRIVLEKLQSTGELSPQMAEAIDQKETELSQIQTDPRLKQAQMDALARMQRVGAEGFTIEDKAALQEAQKDISRANKGREEAILQNMAARGQGGSGAELAARLANAQGAAEQASDSGTKLAALASARTLQGIEQSGALAGNLRNQDYSEQANAAQAQDAINRFNTANRQGVMNANTGASNAAQEYNLSNRQDIANRNAGLTNEQTKYNTQQAMNVYNDKKSRIDDRVRLKTGQAIASSANQANQAAGYDQALTGIGGIATGAKDAGLFGKTKKATDASGKALDLTKLLG